MQTTLGVVPVGDRILVLRDKPVAVTEGGVILADAAQDQPVEGVVLELGTDPGEKCPVKVGDRVIFSPYTGERIKVGSKDDTYLIMRADELLCVRRVLGAPEPAG